jgi:hypothetical protein
MADELAYRVEMLGGGLKGVKPEQLEALLNEVADEGWWLHSLSHQPNSNRMWVILTRRGASAASGARRKKGWSLDWG